MKTPSDPPIEKTGFLGTELAFSNFAKTIASQGSVLQILKAPLALDSYRRSQTSFLVLKRIISKTMHIIISYLYGAAVSNSLLQVQVSNKSDTEKEHPSIVVQLPVVRELEFSVSYSF